MKLTEARLKQVIKEEVEYRLIESVLDDLIVEELKKMGLNEDEWQDEKKRLTRRKILQMLGGAALVGGTGAWIDSRVKAAAAERRADNAAFYDLADAQTAAKESLGTYEGPEFGEQQDYFSNLDFTGAIENTNSLPEDSIGAAISQLRVVGLPNLYISTKALLDKPIPKIKANSGRAALEYYRIKYEANLNKPAALLSLYGELVGIGQVGVSPQNVTIVVNDGGRAVRVLPPEWSILFYFITQEASKLPEDELVDFQNQIYDREFDRFYNTVERGKQEALNRGHEIGLLAYKSGRTGITPEQYREAYPQDNAAHHGAHFFDIGFAAGVAGEKEAPTVPR